MNSNCETPDDESGSLAGFERLRKEAEDAGIPQDGALGAGALAALGEMAPASITIGQLKSVAAGAQRALDLARIAAGHYTRDEDAAHVDPIVRELEELVRQLPAT
ncbi:hypothetical protein [Rubrivivax gelatinosus]|uniref:hypothetical protein n=1 Tax=Rubrivivax gelatinosus TaxID=28068 RepID=UPI0005C234E9|nr:hypothetical protein [Rubrivivax gelatinosus]MBG6083099.1 hypothetical protein [Rubrivivax gelatinosus]